MMIGCVQPGTSRGTFRQMIGSRKMTPPSMLRMVPLGERYISCRLNSFTRASSGVMVAHLTRDADLLGRLRGIDGDLVAGLVAFADAEVEIHQVDIEIRMDQLVLDELPDDPGHLVAVHLDDRVGHFDFRHVSYDLLNYDLVGYGLRSAEWREAAGGQGARGGQGTTALPAAVAIASAAPAEKADIACSALPFYRVRSLYRPRRTRCPVQEPTAARIGPRGRGRS